MQKDRSHPGRNGFVLENARLRLKGEMGRGVQWSVTTSRGAVLEGRVTLALSPQLEVDAGQFKPAYSGEYLISTSDLDFSHRSRVVRAVIPGRDVGAQIRATHGPLLVRVGLFNGDANLPNAEARTGVRPARGALVALRAEYRRMGATPRDTLLVGVSASRNGTPEAVQGSGNELRFLGVRELSSADVRWSFPAGFVTAEWLYAGLATLPGDDPHGGQVTVGVHPGERTTLTLRWDRFTPGTFAEPDATTLWVAGLSHYATPLMRILANAQFPADGAPGGPRLFLRGQIYY